MQLLTDRKTDFPIFARHPELIYLDSAASTQKPKVVIDALTNFYAHNYGTVNRAVYKLAREATDAYQTVRVKVQKLLNASHPEEIIFTRGTTASLNLLARSFGKAFLHPGDVVIISATEHHSNIVPWQMICEERGAVLRVIPVDDQGEILFDEYLELLDDKVKMVSIAHISNALGILHPIKKVTDAAHECGACVCIDGAQSVAHLTLDLQQLDADFFAFSAHKMYGPTGVGVLYGKSHLLEQMPPIEGGGDMIERVTMEKTTHGAHPVKFEAGTPMIAEVVGLGAAIDYLTTIGLETIAVHEQELLHYATQKLLEVDGLRIIGTAPEKGAIISFVIDGVHPLDIASLLDCKQVAIRSGHHCSQPTMDRFNLPGTARLSFGLYNALEEIDYLLSSLSSILELLR
ncbi:MAG: Cysteine desulfurase SufS [Chlamydiae bacterium]|nr:Cysteine desulfurase SufS [Chlamydiota bacterium]